MNRSSTKPTLAGRGVALRRRAGAIAIAAMVASLAAAGCGSSSKSTTNSTSSAAITKPAFLAKGNAICAKTNSQNRAAAAKLGNNPTKAQVTNYVKTAFVPRIQATIDAIKALGAPSGDQATVTNILNLAQTDLNKVKSNPALFVTGGPSTFADFAKIAHAYGLKACARNS